MLSTTGAIVNLTCGVLVDETFRYREFVVTAIRSLLFFEAAAFLVAASIHFGLFLSGREHRETGIAESVIGLFLAARKL